jgi:hypothetical protein
LIGSGYLWRFVERMNRTGLDVRDPGLYRRVTAARDAMHGLVTELHYQSVGHGGGRPPTDGA